MKSGESVLSWETKGEARVERGKRTKEEIREAEEREKRKPLGSWLL